MKNPFALTDIGDLRPPSTALVIFGATGDLTRRKLVPALYNLFVDGFLPGRFVVLGASRRPISDKEFRASLREGLDQYSRRPVDARAWETFSNNIFYQQVTFGDAESFAALKARLVKLDQEYSENFNYLYYLATLPELFGRIAGDLKGAGLIEEPAGGAKTTSIVVEKPFGFDLESSRKLNGELRKSFSERQLFRIDHYLGKETVQNILVFRFANGIFEPLWNRNYVDHIQISVCESEGVGDRGEYFDKAGILRDIVQNHVLQMLSLICIEPPSSFSPNAIRDEKVKVLRSVRRLTPGEVREATVRAAYRAGYVGGQKVPGYLTEEGVAPESRTETFAALQLAIDNWRWAGVPIYIRTGKRLPKRVTEITINFKEPPSGLFRRLNIGSIEQNVLAIQVQPRESITLKINAKPPGPRLRLQPVVMEFSYGHSFGVPSPEAYERLLLDAMKNEPTLFTRDDEIEQAWDLLMPILDGWESGQPPLLEYDAGTWGPPEAESLLTSHGHAWRKL